MENPASDGVHKVQLSDYRSISYCPDSCSITLYFTKKRMDNGMLFDDALVERIKKEPLEGAGAVCKLIQDRLIDQQGWTDEDHEALIEACALLSSLNESGLLPFQFPYNAPSITGDAVKDCPELENYIEAWSGEIQSRLLDHRVASLRSKFSQAFSNQFAYEFSAGDLDQIQAALNDLRVMVKEAPFFEEPHRQRLLRRLEQLQSELHKKISDLDRFWGLVGDAGVALGKFGQDAKPIVDRIREITGIVWRTQTRAEELPSNTPGPLLGSASDEDSSPL